MVMNKRNTFDDVKFGISRGGSKLYYFESFGSSFKQDMIVKGADATSGQPGNNVNEGQDNNQAGGNGAQNGKAADNQGNDQTQTGNTEEYDNQGNNRKQTDNSNNNGNTNTNEHDGAVGQSGSGTGQVHTNDISGRERKWS